MSASDYANAVALNCTSNSVLFSFTVEDSGESKERLMSLSFSMCFQKWKGDWTLGKDITTAKEFCSVTIT